MKINYKMHSGKVTAVAHSRIFCAHDAYAVETYADSALNQGRADLCRAPGQKNYAGPPTQSVIVINHVGFV